MQWKNIKCDCLTSPITGLLSLTLGAYTATNIELVMDDYTHILQTILQIWCSLINYNLLFGHQFFVAFLSVNGVVNPPRKFTYFIIYCQTDFCSGKYIFRAEWYIVNQCDTHIDHWLCWMQHVHKYMLYSLSYCSHWPISIVLLCIHVHQTCLYWP